MTVSINGLATPTPNNVSDGGASDGAARYSFTRAYAGELFSENVLDALLMYVCDGVIQWSKAADFRTAMFPTSYEEFRDICIEQGLDFSDSAGHSINPMPETWAEFRTAMVPGLANGLESHNDILTIVDNVTAEQLMPETYDDFYSAGQAVFHVYTHGIKEGVQIAGSAHERRLAQGISDLVATMTGQDEKGCICGMC